MSVQQHGRGIRQQWGKSPCWPRCWPRLQQAEQAQQSAPASDQTSTTPTSDGCAAKTSSDLTALSDQVVGTLVMMQGQDSLATSGQPSGGNACDPTQFNRLFAVSIQMAMERFPRRSWNRSSKIRAARRARPMRCIRASGAPTGLGFRYSACTFASAAQAGGPGGPGGAHGHHHHHHGGSGASATDASQIFSASLMAMMTGAFRPTNSPRP